MEKIVGLKELRENMDKYAKRVKRGESLLIIKRSKPLFRVSPVEEDWEAVADFTKIRKGGVPIKDLLSRL